jgi:flavin-dependent dehydrogenase
MIDSRRMAKARPQLDVLVLGAHPACYFAASLLKSTGESVAHCTIPGEYVGDRLVQINPQFFSLHKLLAPLKKRLDIEPIHGLHFLADDPSTHSQHAAKAPAMFVSSMRSVRMGMMELARQQKVELLEAKSLEFHEIDENGIELTVNDRRMKPRLLIVGGQLAEQQRKLLGISYALEAATPRRYSFVRLRGSKWIKPSPRQVMPMSLDLRGSLQWAWLLPAAREVQLAVEHAADASPEKNSATELLRHWVDVLVNHRVLNGSASSIDLSQAESIDLPLAGALSHESVANRTLLIGPAGGFYSACGEDIYPNCWSSLFAAEVAQKALRERHLQDALQPYRQLWGTTLGDYLRGPQQNLRFLLPLVYRNPVMTARMTEAILAGASVVR